MIQLIFSMSIIASGLALGYIVQQLVRMEKLRLPFSLDQLRKSLQKTALLFVLPITITGAIWVAQIERAAIAALPLLCIGALMLGGACALLAARFLKLPPHQGGAIYGCGSFTNIGAIGALICFIFLGEAGFALVPIYKIFEELIYYAVGFPIAKYHSTTGKDRQATVGSRIQSLAKDPFILVALSSILIGGMLNFAGVPRPHIFSKMNAVFIPLGTGMLLVSIGLAMQFNRMRSYLKPCLAVAVIKFAIVPLAITSLAYWIGYGDIDNGLPLKVVIILTSMPVAFNALIPPSIYDLDLDLANACWFFTTACLVWVLPVLLFIVRHV